MGAIEFLDQNRIGPFDNLSQEEIEVCLKKSNRISCQKHDTILKKGNTAKNMFIVLSGVVEVKKDDLTIATLTLGDVFGEIAFFLGVVRSMDVIASSDDVIILSLSESQIRNIMADKPEIAVKLLMNVSKMLCTRLLIQGS